MKHKTILEKILLLILSVVMLMLNYGCSHTDRTPLFEVVLVLNEAESTGTLQAEFENWQKQALKRPGSIFLVIDPEAGADFLLRIQVPSSWGSMATARKNDFRNQARAKLRLLATLNSSERVFPSNANTWPQSCHIRVTDLTGRYRLVPSVNKPEQQEPFHLAVIFDQSGSAQASSYSTEALRNLYFTWMKYALENTTAGTFRYYPVGLPGEKQRTLPVFAYSSSSDLVTVCKGLGAILPPTDTPNSAILEALRLAAEDMSELNGFKTVEILSDGLQINHAFNFEQSLPALTELSHWVKTEMPINLSQVHVSMIGFHSNLSPKRMDQCMQLWNGLLAGCGASSVQTKKNM